MNKYLEKNIFYRKVCTGIIVVLMQIHFKTPGTWLKSKEEVVRHKILKSRENLYSKYSCYFKSVLVFFSFSDNKESTTRRSRAVDYEYSEANNHDFLPTHGRTVSKSNHRLHLDYRCSCIKHFILITAML